MLEPRFLLLISERSERLLGLPLKPQPELTPMSNASGDDELKGLLDAFAEAAGNWDYNRYDNDYRDALNKKRQVVESLFGRIKEERDRLEAECLMELLHEPTGKMLPVRVRTVVQALESELGRIREELKEASKARDTYHAIVEDYIRIASVEECAEAVRAWRAPK